MTQAEIDPSSAPAAHSHRPSAGDADRRDLAWAAALGLLGAVLAYLAWAAFPPEFAFDRVWMNRWFQADFPLVSESLLHADSGRHIRITVHPLFSLLAYLPVQAGMAVGLSAPETIRCLFAAVAGLELALFYLVARRLGHPAALAAGLCLVAVAAAGTVFWHLAPESFPVGALSLLVGLWMMPSGRDGEASVPRLTAICVITSAITITNGMLGAVVAFRQARGRTLARVAGCTLAVLFVGHLAQTALFAKARFLPRREESWFLFRPDPLRALQVTRSFLVHSVVSPEVALRPELEASERALVPPLQRFHDARLGRRRQELERLGFDPERTQNLTVQGSSLGGAGPWGQVASALWLALLTGAAFQTARSRPRLELATVLGLVLLGQLALHLPYGCETFLYAAHFTPLLLLWASQGLQAVRPLAAVAFTLVLAACLALNNGTQLSRSLEALREIAEAEPRAVQMDVTGPRPATEPARPPGEAP